MGNILEKANDLYNKAKVFFIGAVDENGFPNIKAMLPVKKRERIEQIYFSTNTLSKHVAQYRANPKSCVYFYSPFFFKGVMLSGMMEVLEDEAIKERFWNKGDTKYYPKGVSDPDYCILKFTPRTGRYYQNFTSEDFIIE
jgi:general stress protein 26